MYSRNDSPLFWEFDLHSVLQQKENTLITKIERLSETTLLATDPEKLAEDLVSKMLVQIPNLDNAEIEVSQEGMKMDVSNDPLRVSFDRSGPVLIDATRITYHIPFTGDAHLFRCKPSSYSLNPPYGKVVGNELRVIYEIIDPKSVDLKSRFQKDLAEIQTHLDRVAADLDPFNNRLTSVALAKINQRRTKLAKDQSVVTELGFRVRPKE